MSGFFTASFDASRVADFLDGFGEQVREALRPAAAAGAKAIYDRVKLNVAGLGKSTGNLDRSIYRVLSESKSTPDKIVYEVSWNASKAPHGHLVEYGYIRRYAYYQNDQGQVRVMVRPGMQGKEKPGRRATPAQKAAYYVTLPSPIHVPGKAFIRSAVSAFDEAYRAAEDELFRRLGGGI